MTGREATRQQIGDAIRVHRVTGRLTQRAVAVSVGRSQQWMSNVERGRANVSADELVRLAGIFGVPVAALLPTTEGVAG